MPNIDSVLAGHVTLEIECIDRLYLNGYLPGLQTAGALLRFLLSHRQQPIASPALLGQMTQRFVAGMEAFAERHGVPFVHFERGQRKEDVAKQHFARFAAEEGVVFIGVAQEKVTAFRTNKEKRPGCKRPFFHFYRGSVYVKQFYVYLRDRDFGPAFIKFSTYCPFAVRVWVNGHEWTKRQLARAGIAFDSLDNGLLSVADAERAQAICDRFNANHIDAFFRKWLARLPQGLGQSPRPSTVDSRESRVGPEMAPIFRRARPWSADSRPAWATLPGPCRLPHPLTREDRAAGYRYRLSIFQMEISRTEVFDRPLAGRQFFEEVIRENLDLGRPERVQLIFDRRVSRRTPGSFRTRVVTAGVEPTLRVEYKRTSIKQYFKLGRALRTETTINDTRDFGVGRDLLRNFDHLRQIGRNANRRLLTVERLSHNCAFSAQTFERVVLPTGEDGQRAPGLRFGDPRVMALLAALCMHLPLPNGFSNRMLRGPVAALQGKAPADYSRAQMTYDLRRLRLEGLIERVPKTHRFVATPAGRRVALFFSKTYARVLRPGLTRLETPPPPDVPDPLATAWRRLDQALDHFVAEAKLAA